MIKIKKLLLLLLILLARLVTFSQAPAIDWQKSFGGTAGEDGPFSIQQTTDGGYIAAGGSFSSNGEVTGHHGGSDYWIVKFDASGNLQWQKSLGGSDDDYASSILETSDGSYIVAGYTYSTNGDVSLNHGGADYWVVKLDGTGNLLWQKSFGGSGDDQAGSMQLTSDGGCVIAGLSVSTDGDVTGNHGGPDYWIVKVDASGNLQWEKSFGGSDDDEALTIQQTSDGGYVVAGLSYSTDGNVTGNHGQDDDWIVKLDATGNLQWQKSLGGSDFDGAYSIKQTTDGGYIIGGSTYSVDGNVSANHGNIDYWIVKIDATGNLAWQKSLGGSGIEEAFSVDQTTDGGYVVAGYSLNSTDGDVTGNHGTTDYWIVKLNPTGNLQWQKSLGGSGDDQAYAIQQTSDGGYIVAGSSSSTDGDISGPRGGNYDYWIVKLAPEAILPVTLYDFTATLENSQVLIQWTTTQEINASKFEVERSGDGVHFTLLGTVSAAHNSSSTNEYHLIDKEPLQGANFYRLKEIDEDGSFAYSVIRKIIYNPNGVNNILILPNPCSTSTTIAFNLLQSQKVVITIFDANGKLVKTLVNESMSAGNQRLTWNVSGENGAAVANGMYYLKFDSGNHTETRKVVVIK